MKVKATILLFALTTTFSFTQSNYQDIVLLKIGDITHGISPEQLHGKSIKNETDQREVFIQRAQTNKLNEETYLGKSESSFNKMNFKPGYKGIAEYGFCLGVGDYGEERAKLNIINGYQINPSISVGIGIGLRYYLANKISLIPVFADFRAGNIRKRSSTYFSFGLGYSFSANPYIEGVGVIVNPEIGISFKISENSAFNIGFGYEMQKIYSSHKKSSAISITIGISFFYPPAKRHLYHVPSRPVPIAIGSYRELSGAIGSYRELSGPLLLYNVATL